MDTLGNSALWGWTWSWGLESEVWDLDSEGHLRSSHTYGACFLSVYLKEIWFHVPAKADPERRIRFKVFIWEVFSGSTVSERGGKWSKRGGKLRVLEGTWEQSEKLAAESMCMTTELSPPWLVKVTRRSERNHGKFLIQSWWTGNSSCFNNGYKNTCED